jgi:hypothetical protein
MGEIICFQSIIKVLNSLALSSMDYPCVMPRADGVGRHGVIAVKMRGHGAAMNTMSNALDDRVCVLGADG